MNRDRDATGRPRSARPRDGLGRPLRYGQQGEPTMPDEMQHTDSQAVAMAQDLLDRGRPFHAHEVLEARWKAATGPVERELWQGLAQLAVGLTHQARGNSSGAAALIRRGRDRLRELPRQDCVDLEGIASWADAWLAGRQEAPLRLTRAVGTAP